jgi:hypothetical protein
MEAVCVASRKRAFGFYGDQMRLEFLPLTVFPRTTKLDAIALGVIMMITPLSSSSFDSSDSSLRL